MNPQDRQIVANIREKCWHAQRFYVALGAQISDRATCILVQRFARHCEDIVQAIACSSAPQTDVMLTQSLMTTTKASVSAQDCVFAARTSVRNFDDLIHFEKVELEQLRRSVKRIKNYALRCRLSSFVATMQMDFDQLKRLSNHSYHQTKGDYHEPAFRQV